MLLIFVYQVVRWSADQLVVLIPFNRLKSQLIICLILAPEQGAHVPSTNFVLLTQTWYFFNLPASPGWQSIQQVVVLAL
jgi:hypothetical protein